jgi:hypothetical protein
MIDDIPLSGNEPIKQAGLPGIGEARAARLEAAGVTTVGELANADIDRLANELTGHFKQWKAETLRQRVTEWVALGQERLATISTKTRGHVFLLTLWADPEGHPLRSRFEYRSPVEPKTEQKAREAVGWSPADFARFVEREAGLLEAKELTEERVDQVELVEWSKHRVAGHLVRGGDSVAVVAEIATQDLSVEGEAIRWRAAGRLIPFGGVRAIDLGTRVGSAQPGETIELAFGSRSVPEGLYRAWFDLAVSPPVSLDRPMAVADLASPSAQ